LQRGAAISAAAERLFLLYSFSARRRKVSGTGQHLSAYFDESRMRAFGAYITGAPKVIGHKRPRLPALLLLPGAPINSRRSLARSFIGTRLCSCLFYWCAVV